MATRVESNEPPPQNSAVDDFLQDAKDNFKTGYDASAEMRNLMALDLDFYLSKQWPEGVVSERQRDRRPSLTINRIPQFVSQVVSGIVGSRPGIQYNPLDNGATPETAEALEDVARTIQIASGADVAYGMGALYQCIMGFGAWEVGTEYASDDNDEQVIVINEISNPLGIILDPSSITMDGSDNRFGFKIVDMGKREFQKRWGSAAMDNWNIFIQSQARDDHWMPEGRVRVCQYYYLKDEWQDTTIFMMPDVSKGGQPTRKSLPTTDFNQFIKDLGMTPDTLSENEGWKILGERKVKRSQCYSAIITPTQILEGKGDEGEVFPCSHIPIVQVLGERLNANGRIVTRGMVRDGIDPQTMYNFWANAMTELIATAPRAPYIGYAGQFKGYENKWNTAHLRNYAYLEAKPLALPNGQVAGLPQRQQFDPMIGSVVQAYNQSANDLKAVMGIFDASLGAPGPEQTGRAILARQQQSEVGNAHYKANHNLSIHYTGELLLEMIPRVYAPHRILKVIGIDEGMRQIILSSGGQAKLPPWMDQDAITEAQGVQAIYDPAVGRYSVSISVGTFYDSRRQEAIQTLLQLVQAFPQMAVMVSDIIVENLDQPWANRLAKRLRDKFQLDSAGGPQIPPQAQQQMQQMAKELQQLKLQQAGDVIAGQTRLSETAMKLQTQKDIATLQAGTQLATQGEKVRADVTMHQAEMAQEMLNMAHEATTATMPQPMAPPEPQGPPQAPPAPAAPSSTPPPSGPTGPTPTEGGQ
jgi:hypothetical protein